MMRENSLKNWQGTVAVIGLDWGDSGKGRLIDDLASRAHVVARYSGGSNAGHTVINDLGRFAFHIIPSGIFNQKAKNVIGRGVACDLESLIKDEMVQLKEAKVSFKNLIIDSQATLTMPYHKLRDGLREKYRDSKIGTTAKGVGPTYADRVERVGLRIKDLITGDFKGKLKNELAFQNNFYGFKLSFAKIYQKYRRFAEIIKPHVRDSIPIVKKAIDKGKNILFEGAQGWLLDIDGGTYPFVTSSNPAVLGIWRSFDIHPFAINHVIGITKAYSTRVGAGPMPTKITGREREIIIERGHEIGTTSGRIRDPGWLDLVAIKTAIDVNRVTDLAITKIDVLTGLEKIKVCIRYKQNGKFVDYLSGDAEYLSACQPVYREFPGWSQDISEVRTFSALPQNAQKYFEFIQDYLSVPVKFISVGPRRGEVIYV